jgi:hypothetical protein
MVSNAIALLTQSTTGYPAASRDAVRQGASDRVFWGSKLLQNSKASMKRCLALARDPSWHELARSGMGLAQPQRYALLQAEGVYVSSPREDTIRLDTLMKLHPDRDFVHLPVTHAFVDRLFNMYTMYVRQRRQRLDRPGGLAFYPQDLVLISQLIARQDDNYFYVSKEHLMRIQQVRAQRVPLHVVFFVSDVCLFCRPCDRASRAQLHQPLHPQHLPLYLPLHLHQLL